MFESDIVDNLDWCVENSLPKKVIYGFRFECRDSQPFEAQEREKEREREREREIIPGKGSS